MADDWIKFRKKLPRDPRVLVASRKCHATRVTICGALVALWCLADDYAEDSGLLPGYTSEDIDREVELPGFCLSLPPDWFELRDGSVYLPNYQEHNGRTARQRAQATGRKQRQRGRENESRAQRDESVTREEKNREEEKNPPNPPSGVGARVSSRAPKCEPDGFAEFWTEYPRKTAKASARKVWQRLAPDSALRQRIRESVRRQAGSEQWQRGVIPHAATWLNQRRWEDEDPGTLSPPPDSLPDRVSRQLADRERDRLEAESLRAQANGTPSAPEQPAPDTEGEVNL